VIVLCVLCVVGVFGVVLANEPKKALLGPQQPATTTPIMLPPVIATTTFPVGPNPIPAPTPTPQNLALQYLTPYSGDVGATVTIYGTGFLQTNTILFGGGPVNSSTASQNGTILTFIVPDSVGADCQAGMACPMFERLITPGTYTVSVRNVNGTSNSLSFIVN